MKRLLLIFATALHIVFLTSCQMAAMQIPVLDTKGDVYKTEGANDPLIYDLSLIHI